MMDRRAGLATLALNGYEIQTKASSGCGAARFARAGAAKASATAGCSPFSGRAVRAR